MVGLYGIARPSLWRDEAYTIEAASRSPGQILALLRHIDAVRRLLHVHARRHHVVRPVRDCGPVAVSGSDRGRGRLLTALGIRLAATGDAPWPRASGLLAGLLYAVAPWVTRYAQEGRSYATVTALAVIATYLLVRALQEGQAPLVGGLRRGHRTGRSVQPACANHRARARRDGPDRGSEAGTRRAHSREDPALATSAPTPTSQSNCAGADPAGPAIPARPEPRRSRRRFARASAPQTRRVRRRMVGGGGERGSRGC